MARPTEFAANWWARRWIGALDRIGWAARLARGRTYARHGRVLDVEISPGQVRARVRGSRPQPYRVTMAVEQFPDEVWDRIVGALSRRALFAAKLLAGELPSEVVDLCASAEAPLFPEDESELATSCSCPDWVNPCKHVAAVHYALAAEFDRDPFLLFRLRGRTRDELTAALRARRGSAGTKPVPASVAAPVDADAEPPSEPLEPLIDRFWQVGPELALLDIDIRPPDVSGAILKRLGHPPVWGSPDEFRASLDMLYRAASASVRDAAIASDDGAGTATGNGDADRA